MAVPEGATKLGTVGIAYKGVYDELATYKYANAVYYNGSTYIALIDNPAGLPSNDGVNWRYLAQGFLQQAISALTVIDESGILGEVNAEVNAQEFLSKIAELQQGLEDTKASKADILDSLEEVIANTEDGRIMGAKAGAELNSNLESKQPTITGGATTITDSNLTASRALVSNSNGKVAVSAVTSTELGYLDGVKSAIQTQLNDKLSKAGGTMTGALNLANGVWNKVGDDAYFGDNNVGGHMCIKPQATGKSSGLRLQNFEETNHVSVYNNASGQLILEATGGGIFLPTSDAVYVSNASNTGRAAIHASDFVQSSSRRLKENIEDMTEEEAKKLLLLNPVTYDYINKDNGTDCKGLIAEDAAKIIPSCVVGNVDCADDDEATLQGIGIDYSKLVPYLIKMVQIQQEEIEAIEFNLGLKKEIEDNA